MPGTVVEGVPDPVRTTKVGADLFQHVIVRTQPDIDVLLVDQLRTDSAVVTAVPAQADVVQLAAYRAARGTIVVFNNSPNNMLVKLGAGASSVSFTVRILAGGYWEMPTGGVYTGIVTGIWEGANPTGNAMVTETVKP